MIARNEVKSDMAAIVGLTVPKIKAELSHDCGDALGHNVHMSQDDEKVAESAWRDAFIQRLRAIQGNRTQDDMADLLGVSRDNYNKWVNRGSAVPTRLLPRLAKIGGVSLDWLIDGPKNQEAAIPTKKRKRA